MKIREISLEEALPIRHSVLWPDKPVEFCIVEGDQQGIHLGVEVGEQLVSVASLYIDGDKARLRKFATLASFRGEGIGTELIDYALEYLKAKEIKTFWCDARESALGFYQRFGMQVEGERFYKSNVPYFKMRLVL